MRKQFNIGTKTIGDGSCLIQSMADRKTEDVDYCISLTNDLAKMGMDMMRFSVLDKEDATSLSHIKKFTTIPIIADIHFDYNLALLSLESGVDKIRINPGNIGDSSHIRLVIAECKKRNVPIRIGVNSGSLSKYKGKGKDKFDDYFLALDDTLSVFQDENFENIVLSLKTSDPSMTEELYTRAYEKYNYPLHLGLTESGFSTTGVCKSSLALFPLLKAGIGDTIRISLADDRKEEIRACKTLLKASSRRKDIPELVVCPTCGRTLIDLKMLARKVLDHLDYVFKDIKIACMGCPVNGIGEAKDADFGIAGSGKKNCYLLFSKGKALGTYEKDEAFSRLIRFIDEY